MKKITLLLLGIALANLVNAQNIRVGDPHREWWYYNQGTIEDADIVVHPQGLYLSVDMYLTFSGKDTYYTNNDTIELVCEFSLPQGSFFYDSWLWLKQDTLIADLIDRWTATTIYNNVVGRRQDPSILYKTYNDNYELRIYPMLGDSTRRVKLSYLTPITYTQNSVFASLPMNIIAASGYPVKNINFYIDTSTTWKNPRIMEHGALTFVNHDDKVFKTNKLLTLNYSSDYYSFTLQFDSPLKNGILVNKLDDDEDYYQMALLPSHFIQNMSPKNTMVCVDYVFQTYSQKSDEVFESIKHTIINGLSPIDSFNIMFSSLDIVPVSDHWIAVKDADDFFDQFKKNPIKEYSNLPTLLFKASQFLKKSKTGGEILLITNTDKDGEPQAANNLIKDLLAEMNGDLIPIHIANYLPYSNYYYWTGSTGYYGNEYLYINLSRQTKGNYSKIVWQQNFMQFLLSFSQNIGGLISSLDLHTSLDNGFCHSRFDLNEDKGFVYLNKPFLQIGKYVGEMPFNIELSGIFNGKAFSESISINSDDVLVADTLLEEAWAGNYIQKLERDQYSHSNDIIREIIDYSMTARVLSIYTAFLAIEPGAVDSLLNDDDDDGEVIDIKENESKDVNEITVKSYPNPFNVETRFELTLPDTFNETELDVKIYDVLGKVVYSDKIQNIADVSLIDYSWKGDDDNGEILPKGTYIVIFSSNSFRTVIKVMKM